MSRAVLAVPAGRPALAVQVDARRAVRELGVDKPSPATCTRLSRLVIMLSGGALVRLLLGSKELRRQVGGLPQVLGSVAVLRASGGRPFFNGKQVGRTNRHHVARVESYCQPTRHAI